MTVANNYIPVKQIGNDVSVNFSFSWKAVLDTDVKVYLEENNIQTLQTLGVDYTLAFNDDNKGGIITFGTAPTSQQYVIIARETDYTQSAVYKTSSGFDSEKVETSFDKNTILIQQLLEEIGRQPVVPLGTTIDNELPSPVASTILGYNSTADGFSIYSSLPESAIVTPVANSYLKRNSANTEYNSISTQNLWDDILANTTFTDDLPKATDSIFGRTLLKKRIIISNNSSDSEHDIDFNPGNFEFSGLDGQAINSNIITKQIDATWTQGTNSGGLASGVSLTPDTTYHCFALSNSEGSLVDFGFDTSIVAGNLLSDSAVILAGLTKYKRVGSIITDGSSNIIGFIQTEKIFILQTITLDINEGDPGTNAVTASLTVPNDIITLADITAQIVDSTFGGTTIHGLFSPLDSVDQVPSTTKTNLAIRAETGSIAQGTTNMYVKTNSSSQIRYRINQSNSDISVIIMSKGWIDINL